MKYERNLVKQHNVTDCEAACLATVTETRVKYEKITNMKYFLEQIGIKLN